MYHCHGLRSLDGAAGVPCSSAPISEGGCLTSGDSASCKEAVRAGPAPCACWGRILELSHRTGMGLKLC